MRYYKYIKYILIIFIILSVNSIAFAAYNFKIDSGLGKSAIKTGYKVDGSMNSLPGMAGVVVGILLQFLGIVFLGLIIYGGFMWMLARGNEADVKKAKDIITNSVIGLVIIIMAYSITVFIKSAV